MDRGGWWATTHRVTKSRTGLKRLSTHASALFHSLLLAFAIQGLQVASQALTLLPFPAGGAQGYPEDG